jgi:site-specific recombinase XerD
MQFTDIQRVNPTALPSSDFEVLPALKLNETLSIIEAKKDAVTDDEALAVFLQSHASSEHTMRSYETQCRRFLLWVRSTRTSSPALLPTVRISDANAYLEFAASGRVFSAEVLERWGFKEQPFRKPLSKTSIAHMVTVLNSWFDAMREMQVTPSQAYCSFNPFKLAHAKSKVQETDVLEMAFSDIEWNFVEQAIEALPRKTDRDHKHYHRCRWVIHLLYRTFLRRDEAVNLRMSDFEPSQGGWGIKLVGKGDKSANIIATERLMAEFGIYSHHLGLSALPSPSETDPVVQAVTGKNRSITAAALYLICKQVFTEAADIAESANEPYCAMRLRKASPHWMRHTGVSHAMEAGVNPRYVQAQARHASLGTTARYDHKTRKAWREDFKLMD